MFNERLKVTGSFTPPKLNDSVKKRKRAVRNKTVTTFKIFCRTALCGIVSAGAIYDVSYRNIPSINFRQINGREKYKGWTDRVAGRVGRITGIADN